MAAAVSDGSVAAMVPLYVWAPAADAVIEGSVQAAVPVMAPAVAVPIQSRARARRLRSGPNPVRKT